ncbi:toll/interleukin-1 receptor domain-containing protein [Frigidibacter sp. ROC022]|uniref:toll/interleukin-1 receptor domain-containing protein n=1 Tax=Frigidibacter sp. ROC022 TaxID=2971796 RepID=UPI00215B636C|nr:toll/interleukin-1 receptor domain-containing protein [Frigidibacter sp. ROC022]MCR8726674.1 toll/interleukin-1 receptor domain-containing protein [Frigidibacter sp. ROC022]
MRAFISYSHKDGAALERLHTHLATLRRDGLLEAWFDREILGGSEIDAEIAAELETCELFLLLVSPDFLASDYCVEREMQRALERHEANEARVVPIIIEPCDWTSSPLRRLKALPHDGKPVSEWTNANNAYLDIVKALRRIVQTRDAEPAEEINATVASQPTAATSERRYRVKRDFDQIDRSEYRESAFATIRDYFQRATAEIDSIEDLRGRFASRSPTTFGCTIVNRVRDRGTAHITVHCANGYGGFGDIYYSFSENAGENTAQGGFSVEADEYEQFLSGGTLMGFGQERQRLSPESAAESLWAEFLDQAGVTYD